MNKAYWNNLFKKRTNLIEPDPFLMENFTLLHGKVLDLASGDGRNSVFLAENGFDVVAVDFSEVALSKIDSLAISKISTHLIDLSSNSNFKSVKEYDSVLINHFIPKDEILLKIQEQLEPKAKLIISSFSDQSEKYTLLPKRVKKLLNNMDVIKLEKFSNEIGSFIGMVLEKKN